MGLQTPVILGFYTNLDSLSNISNHFLKQTASFEPSKMLHNVYLPKSGQ